MASPRSRAQRRARTAFGVVAVAAAAAAVAAAQAPDARAHYHVPTAGVLAVMQTSAGPPEATMRATGIVAARIAQEMAPQQETREGVPAGLPGVPPETPLPETPFELVFGGAHPAFAEVPRCIRDNHQYTVAGAEGREWSAEIGLGPDKNEHIYDVFLLVRSEFQAAKKSKPSLSPARARCERARGDRG